MFFQVLKYTFFWSRFYICIITSVLVLEQLFLKCTKVSPKCQYYCKSPLALASSQCFGGCNGKMYLNILRRKNKNVFQTCFKSIGFLHTTENSCVASGATIFQSNKKQCTIYGLKMLNMQAVLSQYLGNSDVNGQNIFFVAMAILPGNCLLMPYLLYILKYSSIQAEI